MLCFEWFYVNSLSSQCEVREAGHWQTGFQHSFQSEKDHFSLDYLLSNLEGKPSHPSLWDSRSFSVCLSEKYLRGDAVLSEADIVSVRWSWIVCSPGHSLEPCTIWGFSWCLLALATDSDVAPVTPIRHTDLGLKDHVLCLVQELWFTRFGNQFKDLWGRACAFLQQRPTLPCLSLALSHRLSLVKHSCWSVWGWCPTVPFAYEYVVSQSTSLTSTLCLWHYLLAPPVFLLLFLCFPHHHNMGVHHACPWISLLNSWHGVNKLPKAT